MVTSRDTPNPISESAEVEPSRVSVESEDLTNENNAQESNVQATNLPVATEEGRSERNDDISLDDDVTEVGLDDDETRGLRTFGSRLPIDNEDITLWSPEEDAAHEARRRNNLLRELQRVQRANFLHFLMLCLIPTVLLAVILASVFNENQNCVQGPTPCHLQPRTFINAFTSKCICDALTVGN